MKETELIDELQRIYREAEEPDGAYTTDELCDMSGMGNHAMLRRLRDAKRAGRLEVVKVTRERLDGVPFRTVAYRILES